MRRRRSKNTHQRKSRKAIGIIAEDHSDIAVLKVLIEKLSQARFLIRPAVGGGCGHIVGKCRVWAQTLLDQGCRYLLLVHDLDTRLLNQLRSQLTAALSPSPINPYLIVIPVREIEAWLLADHAAITRAMNLHETLKKVSNPEAIQRPKEYLADLVYRKSRKRRRYVNAVDNVKIAELCRTDNLRRCGSFIPFCDFVLSQFRISETSSAPLPCPRSRAHHTSHRPSCVHVR
jgi:hypothetical protein